MSSESQWRDEEHLRALFASATPPAAGESPELFDRIITGAAKRRRRSATLTIVGTTGSTLAIVAALIAGPGLLTAGRDLAVPAGSITGPVTLTATQSPTADSASTATTASTATPSPTTSATSTATHVATQPPATVTQPLPKGKALSSDALVALIPDASTLGPGMAWGLEPGPSSAGAAPVMGFHYCDAIDVPKQLGAATYAAAEQQVATALASASSDADWPTVDIVLAAWTPGHGPRALQQIRDNTGMCVWIGSPNPTAWPGRDGLLITTKEVLFNAWHQASAIQLVGDITVSVSVVDASSAVALERAKVLCDRLAEDVRASGIGQR